MKRARLRRFIEAHEGRRVNAYVDSRGIPFFNLGVGGFSTFRKMIAAVERRDWTAAAEEMRDSIWYHQVGRRADQDIALIASCAVPPPAPGGSGIA
jgi:GH24 family phage-related lysozyme (muramidase)